MSNIQKNFKMKSQLRRMADGGVVDHMSGKSREQQLKEASGEWTPAAAPKAGQPDFRNVQVRVDTTYGQKPKSALQRLFGMADGGKPPQPATEYDFATGHGGSIKGPGGPTDDKVGPVMLSNKEYVLPADTVKAVGVDNLDALRAATHDFDKTKDAKGMAGGGILDRAKDAWSALRGGSAPAAPAAPAAPPNAGTAPVAETVAKSGSRVGSALRGVARGAGIIGTASAPMSGFGDFKADTGGVDTSAGGTMGYLGRGEFGKAGLSLSGGLAETAADATRGVAKTVDGLTGLFGVNADFTGAVDRTLADKTGGYLSLRKPDFSNVQGGVKSTEDTIGGPVGTPSATPVRDVMGSPAMANESGGRTPPPTTYKGDDSVLRGAGGYQGLLENRSGLKNSDPRINGSTSEAYNAMSDDAVIGSYNGKPMTKKEADARAAGLQTASGRDMSGKQSDPMADMLKSALRGGGGGGYSAPSSNARDINARFDALSKDLEGRYGSKGQGNLAKRKLELEAMRSQALDADARNMSSLRGQDMQASSNADQRRLEAAQIAANMLKERNAQAAATSKAGADAAAKAEEQRVKALEGQDKTMNSIMEEIRTRFKDDPTTMEDMTMRLQSAGPEAIGRIAELHGQEKFTAIADLVKSGEIAQAFDKGQSGLWGTTDSGLPRVASERDEPEFFNDVINGGSGVGAALGREIKDTLGFDGGVLIDDNGRVTGRAGVYDDAYRARVAENAAKDAQRRKTLRGN